MYYRIEGCNLQHCGIGIKAFGEVNSVDILNTIIEHGSLAGIVVFSGMNMNIQGNCIEGIEGPAIVSSNMDSLTISNNYFESNNIGTAHSSKERRRPLFWRPFWTVAEPAPCPLVPLPGFLASRRRKQRKNGEKTSKNGRETAI